MSFLLVTECDKKFFILFIPLMQLFYQLYIWINKFTKLYQNLKQRTATSIATRFQLGYSYVIENSSCFLWTTLGSEQKQGLMYT